MWVITLCIIVLSLIALVATVLSSTLPKQQGADHTEELIDKIDRLLPQTQCGDCGYPGCRPYARAIANHESDINCCPPGGDMTIQALAHLLGREIKPLDPTHGPEKPLSVALIDEEVCIGCVKCIQACPVDAIVGAPKQIHTVLEQECTGCELCLPPCPVDCITMVKPPYARRDWHWAKPEALADTRI